MKAKIALAVLVLCGACRSSPRPDAPNSSTERGRGTPVRVAVLALGDIPVVLEAAAHTEALAKVRVVAPFSGTLVTLGVAEGDRVRAGQNVGAVVARESEAAARGAQSMLREAKSPSETADARRAVELATAGAISARLVSPTDGVVLTRSATAGDRVTDGEELLTIAGAGSIVLLAEVSQASLTQVRAGQTATVTLAAGQKIEAVVHGILPSADSATSTARIRLDARQPVPLGVGLYGSARIVLARRENVLVAPSPAVLRDDIRGSTRIAVVGSEGTAHWVEVRAGASSEGLTEIDGGDLAPGARVIVSGQVGLPDGALVVVDP